MILILGEPSTQHARHAILQALKEFYDLPTDPTIVPVDAVWNNSPEWDDLLIITYRSPTPEKWVQDFIASFRATHSVADPATGVSRPGGFVLPVALDPDSLRPPDPISGIKALSYDGSDDANERLVHAAGVLLGMSVRPGRHQIFVSYRSADGSVIAADLHHRLEAAGFNAWLDEARENLSPGDNVQEVIRALINHASLVLVVDTPAAPASRWIKDEIDTAIGQLVPVLPVVIGPNDISRFIPLASLRRRVPVKPAGVDGCHMSDLEWSRVRTEIDQLLVTTYRRRLLTISRAERVFSEKGFDWTAIDASKRMYWSRRKQMSLPEAVVLSHCSIHDATYMPALKAYKTFIDGFSRIAQVNHKVCVYDDLVLSDAEIETIGAELQGLPFVLAHHTELGILILSNFARLR